MHTMGKKNPTHSLQEEAKINFDIRKLIYISVLKFEQNFFRKHT